MDDKVPVLGSVMVQQGLVGWLNKGAFLVEWGTNVAPRGTWTHQKKTCEEPVTRGSPGSSTRLEPVPGDDLPVHPQEAFWNHRAKGGESNCASIRQAKPILDTVTLPSRRH